MLYGFKDGKYDIINNDGQIVVPPIYDKADLTFFDNRVATVEKEGEKFKINTKGEIVN